MVNRIAATLPGSMTPLAVLRGVSVTHFSQVVVISDELDAGGVRDHRHGRTPRHDQQLRDLEQRSERRRAADAHLVLVVALVVGVVEQLRRAHRPHLAAQPHQGHREQVVGEPGVDAGGEARRAALLARRGDRVDPARPASASSSATPTASSRWSRRRCRRAGTPTSPGCSRRRTARSGRSGRARPAAARPARRPSRWRARRWARRGRRCPPRRGRPCRGWRRRRRPARTPGASTTSAITSLPTTPVPQTTTRFFSNVIGRTPPGPGPR